MKKREVVAPWVWGEYCRTLEAALPRLRPGLGEATRKRFHEQLFEVTYENEKRGPDERYDKAVCAFCGDLPFSTGFVLAERARGEEPRFTWSRDTSVPAERGTVLCRLCMHRALQERDRDLAELRSITLELPDAARYLPMFDKVDAARIVRMVRDEPCVICRKRRLAVRGVEAVVCTSCHDLAHAVFRAAMAAEKAGAAHREERYEEALAAYLRELRRRAEEEARAALGVRKARRDEAWEQAAPGPTRPNAAPTPADREADWAISFLASEVERAARHQRQDGDLMGDRTKIARVLEALLGKTPPSDDRLLHLLILASMLRQVMADGVAFHDYTGDELINEPIGAYDMVGSTINVGLGHHALAAEQHGALLITGGSRAKRAAASAEIHAILKARSDLSSPFRREPAFQFFEAEDLIAMPEAAQQEVRRKMLVTPPFITLCGAESLDHFLDEVPKRAKVRVVTYFFLDGQAPLDLDRGAVHVQTAWPPLARPAR
ncbi:MAG: hypothetical protein U0359_05825 [Byssovorax sp.]